jgi:outer membrane PBP1 activator LpoA protein
MSIRSLGFALLCLLPLILATAGCQSTPTPASRKDRAPAPERSAEPAGPAAAANTAREGLDTAERLLRTGDWVGAQGEFSAIARDALASRDVPRYTLLGAELALRSGRFDEARQLLAGLDTAGLADPLQASLAESLLLAATGEPARAATSLMALAAAAADAQRVNDAIWELATLTPAFDAVELAEHGSDVERGWWSLRRDLLASSSLADERERVRAWQAAWPDHPGARNLPTALADAGAYAAPQHVALLLPVTGPLARAGRAVRDGFMAAYLEQRPAAGFTVVVYDTNGVQLPTLYERAIADGADVLVGPLLRDEVTALNDVAPAVPVLALNYLGAGDPAPNVTQLGLAIEDDAATLAAWLRDAAYERVLILHGSHEWSTRVTQALAEHGIVPADSYLLPDLRTVTEDVGTALHVEESEARHAELQQLLGTPLLFRARSRSDIEAVVALVNSVEVTALVPALRFHYADRIPAFATAQTLQGASAGTYRTMNRFNVVELPWQAPGNPGFERMAGAFALAGNPFASMYGFGADAFRLVDRVHPENRRTFTQILGNTGVITLQPDGRWRRELARMRIQRGALVPAIRAAR